MSLCTASHFWGFESIESQILEDITIQIFIESFARRLSGDLDVQLSNQNGGEQDCKDVPRDAILHFHQFNLEDPGILPWKSMAILQIFGPKY